MSRTRITKYEKINYSGTSPYLGNRVYEVRGFSPNERAQATSKASGANPKAEDKAVRSSPQASE